MKVVCRTATLENPRRGRKIESDQGMSGIMEKKSWKMCSCLCSVTMFNVDASQIQ